MKTLIILALSLSVTLTADAKKKKETPCEKATRELREYLKENGNAIDRCAAANAIGRDYPECQGLAENTVTLEQQMTKYCD